MGACTFVWCAQRLAGWQERQPGIAQGSQSQGPTYKVWQADTGASYENLYTLVLEVDKLCGGRADQVGQIGSVGIPGHGCFVAMNAAAAPSATTRLRSGMPIHSLTRPPPS